MKFLLFYGHSRSKRHGQSFIKKLKEVEKLIKDDINVLSKKESLKKLEKEFDVNNGEGFEQDMRKLWIKAVEQE